MERSSIASGFCFIAVYSSFTAVPVEATTFAAPNEIFRVGNHCRKVGVGSTTIVAVVATIVIIFVRRAPIRAGWNRCLRPRDNHANIAGITPGVVGAVSATIIPRLAAAAATSLAASLLT
jgi:hypothetical protein